MTPKAVTLSEAKSLEFSWFEGAPWAWAIHHDTGLRRFTHDGEASSRDGGCGPSG